MAKEERYDDNEKFGGWVAEIISVGRLWSLGYELRLYDIKAVIRHG